MNVQCQLCPKACVIKPGQSGECRIRVNIGGRLRSVTYGYPSAVHRDPIEKKPLNHFLPGSQAFSIATVGCNLHCKNCQNWEISQTNPEQSSAMHLPPERLAREAKNYGCKSVAYTYTEPLVYYEYTLDSCRRVKEAGLKNVLVSAGYVNDRPLRELCRYLDAANIDLKAFSDRFYRDVCGATLKPVLHSLVTAKSLGVMVEVTNLLLPTLNDGDNDIRALCRWIKENMGPDTPLHFSRFHPDFRMRHLPPTPPATLARARSIAHDEGLCFIYVGNILMKDASNTFCPVCGALQVERHGYQVIRNNIKEGKCQECGSNIYGVWV